VIELMVLNDLVEHLLSAMDTVAPADGLIYLGVRVAPCPWMVSSGAPWLAQVELTRDGFWHVARGHRVPVRRLWSDQPTKARLAIMDPTGTHDRVVYYCDGSVPVGARDIIIPGFQKAPVGTSNSREETVDPARLHLVRGYLPGRESMPPTQPPPPLRVPVLPPESGGRPTMPPSPFLVVPDDDPDSAA